MALVRNALLLLLLPVNALSSGPAWEHPAGAPASVRSLAVIGPAVIACTDSGIYRSVNGGIDWTMINANFQYRPLTRLGGSLYAGRDFTIFASADSGATWLPTAAPNYPVITMAAGTAELFAGTFLAGVYVSADGGGSWTDIGPAGNVEGIALLDSTLFAWSDIQLLRAVRTPRGWGEWRQADSAAAVTFLPVSIVSGQTLYSKTDGGVYRTTDGGDTWNIADSGLGGSTVNAFAGSGDSIFAGTTHGVFRLDQIPGRWGQAGSGLEDSNIAALAGADGRLIAATASGGLWILQTAAQADTLVDRFPLAVGTRWTYDYYRTSYFQCFCDFGSGGYTDSGEASYLVTARRLGADSTIWDLTGMLDVMRTSSGCSYPYCTTSRNPYRDSVRFTVTEYMAGDHLLKFGDDAGDKFGVFPPPSAGCSEGSFYRYRPASAGVRDTGTFCGVRRILCADTGEVSGGFETYDYNGNGVLHNAGSYVLRGSVFTAILPSPAPPIPARAELLQNYPNPFNPSTRIRFALPVAGHASLRVYDLLGREVAVLADGEFTPGTYERELQAGGLAGGIYFCRLSAGNFSAVRALLLAK